MSPTPPKRLTPPITAAVIAVSSYPCPSVTVVVVSKDVRMIAPTPRMGRQDVGDYHGSAYVKAGAPSARDVPSDSTDTRRRRVYERRNHATAAKAPTITIGAGTGPRSPLPIQP